MPAQRVAEQEQRREPKSGCDSAVDSGLVWLIRSLNTSMLKLAVVSLLISPVMPTPAPE